MSLQSPNRLSSTSLPHELILLQCTGGLVYEYIMEFESFAKYVSSAEHASSVSMTLLWSTSAECDVTAEHVFCGARVIFVRVFSGVQFY